MIFDMLAIFFKSLLPQSYLWMLPWRCLHWPLIFCRSGCWWAIVRRVLIRGTPLLTASVGKSTWPFRRFVEVREAGLVSWTWSRVRRTSYGTFVLLELISGRMFVCIPMGVIRWWLSPTWLQSVIILASMMLHLLLTSILEESSGMIYSISTTCIYAFSTRLNAVRVGKNSVLKSFTRLLSGSSMESRSILLEHTLVLAGETVESGSVWQGWPSVTQEALSVHRSRVKYLLDRSLQFRETSGQLNEKSEGSRSKKSLLRRVFYSSTDSSQWKHSDITALRGDERIPLLKSGNDIPNYSNSFEVVWFLSLHTVAEHALIFHTKYSRNIRGLLSTTKS